MSSAVGTSAAVPSRLAARRAKCAAREGMSPCHEQTEAPLSRWIGSEAVRLYVRWEGGYCLKSSAPLPLGADASITPLLSLLVAGETAVAELREGRCAIGRRFSAMRTARAWNSQGLLGACARQTFSPDAGANGLLGMLTW